CAFDPLFLARIIGDLDVATADPVSGEAITYHISGDGAITGASHPDAALSFLRPDKPWGDDVQTTFCHYVLHFTSPATARQWTAEHPGTFAISLDDASELARRHTARTFGTAAAA
ncbi:MAG TPA: organomercurial lyase, partial [Streptosporangiaceae bacterium]